MTTNETQPALRGHHAFLTDTFLAELAEGVEQAERGELVSHEEAWQMIREQEEADSRGREEAELWARRWLVNEASIDCE